MNQILFRTLLSVLPLLGWVLDTKSGLAYGALGAGALVLATLLFLLLRLVLPETLRELTLFLLLLGFGVALHRFFSLSPILVVSLSLLALPDLYRTPGRGKRVLQKTLLVSLSFFLVVLVHGLLAELLGLKAGLAFFQTPAGSFWWMGLALSLLPGKKRVKR